MKIKKYLIGFVLVITILALAACSVLNQSGLGQSTSEQASAGGFDPASMPVEMKLAVGTLGLEETDQSVTAGQASQLLPLWKAVQSLSNSETVTEKEIQALYDQIEETMTPEQMKTIEAMDLDQEQMANIMENLGIEMPQFGGGGMQDLSEEERAARVAEFQSRRGGEGGAMPGGAMPGGGGPGGGQMPEGGIPGNFPGGTGGQVSGTPQAEQSGRRSIGMNTMFVDPLIELLEARAGE